MAFELISPFKPTCAQLKAVNQLIKGLENNLKHQVLLGVTGSGKTFTMAKVIEKINQPTLVISHNKTLAAQLYQEFKSFFPKNAVSYFVSYYDYYQPEAYIPQTDTYIEKEVDINEEIDRLRLEATTHILTRKDVIVVASVSCIYNLGSPVEHSRHLLKLKLNQPMTRSKMLENLIALHYERSPIDLKRGCFRVRGEIFDIFPSHEQKGLRLKIEKGKIKQLSWINPITGKFLSQSTAGFKQKEVFLYPTKHYMTDLNHTMSKAFSQIRQDLSLQLKKFRRKGKELEAQRLEQRVNYDLEMIAQTGYVNGIENYSRYFDGRLPGEPPYTLLDYFKKSNDNDWLLFVDESHQTIPQLQGMYRGDRSRKKVLIEHGFRLPAALDNRPLKFKEFLAKIPRTIYVSATPSRWEIEKAERENKRASLKNHCPVIELLVRPTGVVDPEIFIRPTKGQIDDLIREITLRIQKKERVLVTTLTKRTAEALSSYLKKKGIKVHYLHCDIKTLKRSDILDDLRQGKYDVIVGINLLREGLDLPEVSLVAILDADKEGFLRSETSLIQTMGRAARHVHGKVIMYADQITTSMRRAIEEIHRRREVQIAYNKKHLIKPRSVKKPIREKLVERKKDTGFGKDNKIIDQLKKIDFDGLTPDDRRQLIKRLEKEMRYQARALNFELAAVLRDKIRKLERTQH